IAIVNLVVSVSEMSVVSVVVITVVAGLAVVVVDLVSVVVLVVVPQLLVWSNPGLPRGLHSASALLQTDVLDDVVAGLLDEHLFGESVGDSVFVLVDLELLAVDLLPCPGSLLLERHISVGDLSEFLGETLGVLDGGGERGQTNNAEEEEGAHP
ncbi:hypothetical protein PMAYCL1PPCAC_32002, partial [Pristionchus mayeri]